MHALGFHLLVITPKVIGLQKQENSSTGLILYRLLLLWADRLRQQEICSVTVRRRNLHPAFASAEMRILDQIKEGKRNPPTRIPTARLTTSLPER